MNFIMQGWFGLSRPSAKAFVTTLTAGEPLLNKSRLQLLSPFLDNEGVFRVGGRLQSSGLAFRKKDPVLLPARHELTNLILDNEHNKRNLHAGPQLLIASLRQRYWIIGARNIVRDFVRKCVVCCRHRASVTQQMMGSLPIEILQPARPFSTSGYDQDWCPSAPFKDGKMLDSSICLLCSESYTS
jgi:hypothetical protein